ncbi:glycosyltransferase [Hyunsoonleella flava]|uniref:Glycosyltransferase n=1 Tax=Hyunsoonleella flava TaxID=2527939 RepID=A0A4Q9FGM4_9FLAO|nr:glycosyltransferase family 4 protein [Hyunsoonleella flava]TBN03614.1 glycosyltransferase [Hyunsoonleella flava]
MRFLIITHVVHKPKNKVWYAYAPYVREMNLWLKYVDEVEIVAPITNEPPSVIDMAYKHDDITFTKIPSIAFITLGRSLLSLLSLPLIFLKLYKACKRADHIHLRCPGNIGLLGCLVQICFPKKVKTAKYAGNWDPKASQPLSYRFQKRILSSTGFIKNMTAIVYGKWQNQSKNIKPFFTATYSETDKIEPKNRNYSGEIKFVFVGSLVEGKRPLLAIHIVEQLVKKNCKVTLDLYGEGVLKQELIEYCNANHLDKSVVFHGNQKNEVIKQVLQTAHFSILASKSEGWPKAIAEAMFFGVIPIATSISCVPFMLDYGKRGILISSKLNEAVSAIENHLRQQDVLLKMSKSAAVWSQKYTLEAFEEEIKKLIIT